MTAYHTYFVTSLDLQLVELEDFKYGGTNITAFRLVDPGQRAVQVSESEMLLTNLQGCQRLNRTSVQTVNVFKTINCGSILWRLFDHRANSPLWQRINRPS